MALPRFYGTLYVGISAYSRRVRNPIYSTCSRCGGPNGRRHRWCRTCKNEYDRGYRGGYARLSEAARQRHIARAIARVYRKRGHLVPKPCELCGSKDVQMHHDDYSHPLAVRWVCTDCHPLLDAWRQRAAA